MERTKKKVQVWKKALFHFLLCFVLGFFTGFAPITKPSSIFYNIVSAANRSAFSPQPIEMVHLMQNQTYKGRNLSNITSSSTQSKLTKETRTRRRFDEAKTLRREKEKKGIPKELLIIVTPTNTKDRYRGVRLMRLASTLRLAVPPLLWVVVEQRSESSEVSEILRKTGIMYRHVVFKKNFTNIQREMNHQRNLALKHIEHHRLSGIVHFAGLSNVYDLTFFDQIRAIEVFGTWAMAILTANSKKVEIQGPVCNSYKVIGWHLKIKKSLNNSIVSSSASYSIPISSFAFNTSILWDPERWGRTSPLQDTSQDSLKFVEKEIVEEDANLKGISGEEDCNKILVWNFRIPLI